MKIKTIETPANTYGEKWRYEIEIDGETKVSVGPMEPEDVRLYRDLAFVKDFVLLLELAHKAGAAGEPLSIVNKKVKR